MRYDEDLLRKLKNEAEEWLFRIPGVYGVALGPKMIGGELTTDLAIQVFVKDKRPPGELASEEIIPREIKGIKTDVLRGGAVVRAAGQIKPPFRTCPNGMIISASNA